MALLVVGSRGGGCQCPWSSQYLCYPASVACCSSPRAFPGSLVPSTVAVRIPPAGRARASLQECGLEALDALALLLVSHPEGDPWVGCLLDLQSP